MGDRRLAFGLASLLGVFAVACTLVTDLDGLTCGADCDVVDGAPESAQVAPPNDASKLDMTTSSSVDAGIDGADAAVVDSSVPPAFTYFCPGTGKVSDCATCASGGYPCILCGSAGSDVTRVRGVCVTSPSSGSACEGKGPPGYDDCLCAGTADPSPCPAPYQVCAAQNGPACRTCGFPGSTGQSCKGGGTCSATTVCK